MKQVKPLAAVVLCVGWFAAGGPVLAGTFGVAFHYIIPNQPCIDCQAYVDATWMSMRRHLSRPTMAHRSLRERDGSHGESREG